MSNYEGFNKILKLFEPTLHNHCQNATDKILPTFFISNNTHNIHTLIERV